eukprot:TRINITY_DN27180_c0_g2_i1.p1 TRINITY_DN27180_c0_g2~~TRINITY_DN27180_c0_g2_i1.p1  ORF type:complete len:233 (+),score=15.22 TRINITY_DN27180_c0_g2_i1:106-804(+)
MIAIDVGIAVGVSISAVSSVLEVILAFSTSRLEAPLAASCLKASTAGFSIFLIAVLTNRAHFLGVQGRNGGYVPRGRQAVGRVILLVGLLAWLYMYSAKPPGIFTVALVLFYNLMVLIWSAFICLSDDDGQMLMRRQGPKCTLESACARITIIDATSHRCPTSSCGICLDDFSHQDSVAELPCGHVFHTACVDAWIRSPRLASTNGVLRICPMRCLPEEPMTPKASDSIVEL